MKTAWEWEEYFKCAESVQYFAENYCQIKREEWFYWTNKIKRLSKRYSRFSPRNGRRWSFRRKFFRNRNLNILV
jgi:hypothetical protein